MNTEFLQMRGPGDTIKKCRVEGGSINNCRTPQRGASSLRKSIIFSADELVTQKRLMDRGSCPDRLNLCRILSKGVV